MFKPRTEICLDTHGEGAKFDQAIDTSRVKYFFSWLRDYEPGLENRRDFLLLNAQIFSRSFFESPDFPAYLQDQGILDAYSKWCCAYGYNDVVYESSVSEAIKRRCQNNRISLSSDIYVSKRSSKTGKHVKNLLQMEPNAQQILLGLWSEFYTFSDKHGMSLTPAPIFDAANMEVLNGIYYSTKCDPETRAKLLSFGKKFLLPSYQSIIIEWNRATNFLNR